MEEKEDFLWEDDNWASWNTYCPLAYYSPTEEELENSHEYDEIESFDEKEYELEPVVGRGRAFRRKMFFKKEKYKKNDVSYPKKSRAHRKVFDTYDVCDY